MYKVICNEKDKFNFNCVDANTNIVGSLVLDINESLYTDSEIEENPMELYITKFIDTSTKDFYNIGTALLLALRRELKDRTYKISIPVNIMYSSIYDYKLLGFIFKSNINYDVRASIINTCYKSARIGYTRSQLEFMFPTEYSNTETEFEIISKKYKKAEILSNENVVYGELTNI